MHTMAEGVVACWRCGYDLFGHACGLGFRFVIIGRKIESENGKWIKAPAERSEVERWFGIPSS